MPSPKRVLFIVSCDARLHDNPTLCYANNTADFLGIVYVKDIALDRSDSYGLKRTRALKKIFEEQSLADFDRALRQRGQFLLSLSGDPFTRLSDMIGREEIDEVVISRQAGGYETQLRKKLRQQHPAVTFTQIDSHTLFTQIQVDQLARFPGTASQFRRKMEARELPQPVPTPQRLKPSFLAPVNACGEPERDPSAHWMGGEEAALARLDKVFDGQLPHHYKETRNAFDGWENATHCSAWLANGNLSVRHIHARLRRYETEHGANESSEWIFFELMWREYFQWYARHHGTALFSFRGIHGKKPLTTFYPERFAKWCQGLTPWPIVNACMHQLNTTGFMSNRGRQIVASCLVNELGIDWRAGAAYFEQQLLDYDVASNWGNWQYIAGVGADPRGGRHFNIDKQSEHYDPDGAFTRRWPSTDPGLPLDSVDAADWPL